MCRPLKKIKTMSEVNHNANSFDSEAISTAPCDRSTGQREVTETSESVVENSHLSAGTKQDSTTQNSKPLTQKMDWQKVAHKLREHNRKLYKNIFRLEQELADLDNKFNKYVEKSQNSDLLLAQQAEEIKKYQENVSLLTQQLTTSQKQIEDRELSIERLSEQYQLSQKQTAQLERECTLLQETYNHQRFELTTKERENQELQAQLSQHQQNALQREAELKRYREAEASRKKVGNRQYSYPHNRYIKPWSTATIAEPKIAFPQAKSKSTKAQKTAENIEVAAKIATRSAAPQKQTEKTKTTAKSTKGKKPQSLAAVDLPTFPRPQ